METNKKNWDIAILKDIILTASGGTPSRKKIQYFQGNIPWVKSGELTDSYIYETEEHISESAVHSSSAKIFPKGSLLIALYGATIGKMAFLGVPAATNQAVCCLFNSPSINSYFLFYYLLLKRSFLINQGKGGAQKNISQETLKLLQIPVPPMAEQKRIVKKIEELFGVIDEQVKRLEATQEALVSYRQSILQQAFSGKLYKTSTWEEVPLKKCCLPVIKRKDSKDPSEKFLYLDIASIDNKTNKIIEGTPYRGDTAPSRARQIVQKDDVLFSTVRTYLKNIALITDSKYNNQIASTGFCVIRANQKMLLPYFIFYKTLSDAFLSPLNAKQRGSSYPAVRDGDVLSSIIDLPSLPDQKAIVKKIETAFAFADKVQTVITDALEQAKQLKQSILKRAFEGQLVSQDPNDKPVDLTQLKKEKPNDRSHLNQ